MFFLFFGSLFMKATQKKIKIVVTCIFELKIKSSIEGKIYIYITYY